MLVLLFYVQSVTSQKSEEWLQVDQSRKSLLCVQPQRRDMGRHTVFLIKLKLLIVYCLLFTFSAAPLLGLQRGVEKNVQSGRLCFQVTGRHRAGLKASGSKFTSR